MMLRLFSINYCSNRAAIPLYHCIYFLNPFVLFLGKGSERQYSFQQDLSGNIKDLQKINVADAFRNLLEKDLYWTAHGTYPQNFYCIIPFDGAEISVFDTRFKGNYALRYLNIGFNSFDGLYLSGSIYRILWSREEIQLDPARLYDGSGVSRLRLLNPFNFVSISLGIKLKLCRLHEFFVSLYTDNDDHKIRKFPNYHRFLFDKDMTNYERNLNMIGYFKDYAKLKERQVILRLKIQVLSEKGNGSYGSLHLELKDRLIKTKEVNSEEFNMYLEGKIDLLARDWSDKKHDRKSIIKEYRELERDSDEFVRRVKDNASIRDQNKMDFITSLNSENERIRDDYSIPKYDDSKDGSQGEKYETRIDADNDNVKVNDKNRNELVESTAAILTKDDRIPDVDNYTDSISTIRHDMMKDNLRKSLSYNVLGRFSSSGALIGANYGNRIPGNFTSVVEQYGHNTESSPKQVEEKRQMESMMERKTYQASAYSSLENTIGAYKWFLMVFELKQSLDNVLWGFIVHLIHFDLALNFAFSTGTSPHDLIFELTWSPIKTLVSYIRHDTYYFNLEVNFDYGNRMIRNKKYSLLESKSKGRKVRNLKDLRLFIFDYLTMLRRYVINLRILLNQFGTIISRRS